MLEHLEQRIEHSLQRTEGAVLSTTGSLGLQAGHFPCEYHKGRMYLMVPATIDVLENLNHPVEVLVTSPGWQLLGIGQALSRHAIPSGLLLHNRNDMRWEIVVEVRPIRIHLQPGPGYSAGETIDFDLERTEK